jgi:hypothetical protein
MRFVMAFLLISYAVNSLCHAEAKLEDSTALRDWRHVKWGLEIPDESYCDQPRFAVLDDGTWLCVLTTGSGHEGQGGQHIVCTRSQDQGKTWSALVNVEGADTVKVSSYAVVYKTLFDRVYCFYTYNGDSVTALPNGTKMRYDTQGWLVYRFTDDGGRTWSPRQRLHLRVTDCDRSNDFEGEVQMFWMIGKPIRTPQGAMMLALTKLRRYFLQGGEGWVMRCENIDTERDITRLQWSTLPAGEAGVRHPEFGSVQEEFNLTPLQNGLAVIFRTTLGFPGIAFSRDEGQHWTVPEQMRYAPEGRVIRNPRACPKIWQCQNGKYLFWFHNHGGKNFEYRNPAWILGGVEQAGRIVWSQPEILLYGDVFERQHERFSYPDLIEENGAYYISETQKTVARVHRIDKTLLEGMWNSLGAQGMDVTPAGLALDISNKAAQGTKAKMPLLPDLNRPTQGMTLSMWIKLDRLIPGTILLDSRNQAGQGVCVSVAQVNGKPKGNGVLRIELSQNGQSTGWDTDPGRIEPGRLHHVVFTVDAGPRIISSFVDGVICDGSGLRQFGWGRYAQEIQDVNGSVTPRIASQVWRLQIYTRCLRAYEVLGLYNARPTAYCSL